MLLNSAEIGYLIDFDPLFKSKPMSEQTETQWIAGFWARVWAFVIDSFLLAIPLLVAGYILILILKYYALAAWFQLAASFMFLAYFSLLNSKIGNGQTVGKKYVGIRVVDANNNPISFFMSLLRSSVFYVLFFLEDISWAYEYITQFNLYVEWFLVGGTVSILYLYVSNKKTRQSLHDLVVGSYVVNANAKAQKPALVWKAHFYIVAVLLIAPPVIVYFRHG